MTPKVMGADSPARAAGRNSKTAQTAEKPVLIEPLPMKPRRGLLVVLSIVFVCWVGWLVATYFTTVRPREREQAPPTSEPSRGVALSSTPAWLA